MMQPVEITKDVVLCDSLWKRFGEQRTPYILRHINFKVKQGSLLVFLGPNGSGKSTLIHLILGLLFPSKGDMLVFEKNDLELTRGRIGYLPERLHLPLNFTPNEYLNSMASMSGPPGDSRGLDIQNVIQFLGLNQVEYQPMKFFSAGLLKRVGLAAALLGEPDFLIMDEPFDNLDNETQEDLLIKIELWKTQGKTVILSTHHLDFIENLNCNLLILNQGEIIYDGTSDDFKGNHSSVVFEFANPEEQWQNYFKDLPLKMDFTNDSLILSDISVNARSQVIKQISDHSLVLEKMEVINKSLKKSYQELFDKQMEVKGSS